MPRRSHDHALEEARGTGTNMQDAGCGMRGTALGRLSWTLRSVNRFEAMCELE